MVNASFATIPCLLERSLGFVNFSFDRGSRGIAAYATLVVTEAPTIGNHGLPKNQYRRPRFGGVASDSDRSSWGKLLVELSLGMAIRLQIARIPHFRCPMRNGALIICHVEIQLGMRVGKRKMRDRSFQNDHFVDVVRNGGSVVGKQRNRGCPYQ